MQYCYNIEYSTKCDLLNAERSAYEIVLSRNDVDVKNMSNQGDA